MSKRLKLSGIIEESISNGPGIRMVVFAQGCPHQCAGCHNPQTHDPQQGFWSDLETIFTLATSNPLLDGVTFSGGEPFEQANGFYELAQMLKTAGLSIAIYTGYTFEALSQSQNRDWQQLLGIADLLIDGPFVESKKNGLLKFRGSDNQRIINVSASLETSDIVIASV